MNFVNPIGRQASNSPQPRACMCKNTGQFLSAKSSNDSCSFCGCLCGMILSNGNFTTASVTYKKS